MAERDRVSRAMEDARAAVERQLGSARPAHVRVDAADLPRFAADLPAQLTPAQRDALVDEADALQPWLQGPFHLGGGVVVGGAWRSDRRWLGLAQHVPDVTGRRVLDVGANAGYDAFAFRSRGAAEVLACEPHAFINQARFLERIYASGIRVEPLGWQDLDPAAHGTFDLVHCHGLLYHEAHPMALLQRLRAMTAAGGTLLLGTMMLADPELSEHVRFVPGAYHEDETWWWVPGRLAMRWMLEAVGFAVVREFGTSDGPPGEFATLNAYFEAVPAAPAPAMTTV